MWKLLLCGAVMCVAVKAMKLPSYMTPCPFNAPIEVVSACAEKNANSAIPHFGTGDKKYRIPSMNPLVVPKMAIAQGTNQIGMTLKWNPAHLWGLDRAKVSNMVVDCKKTRTEFDIKFPTFVISGRYMAGGRLLLLPITGEGNSNVSLVDLNVRYHYDWPIKKGRDGKQYANVQNGVVEIKDIGSMSFKFEGLFGGDRLLSTNMHTFLNENWREVVKEIGPGVSEAVGEVVRLVVANLAQLVPINEMFSDVS